MNACPVCGCDRVHQERVYVIAGRRVTMRFSDCLHTPEEIAAAERSNGAGPPGPTPLLS